MSDSSPQWKAESLRWRGRVLIGKYGHWCPDWDDLTIDETCPEWPCSCAPELRREVDNATPTPSGPDGQYNQQKELLKD